MGALLCVCSASFVFLRLSSTNVFPFRVCAVASGTLDVQLPKEAGGRGEQRGDGPFLEPPRVPRCWPELRAAQLGAVLGSSREATARRSAPARPGAAAGPSSELRSARPNGGPRVRSSWAGGTGRPVGRDGEGGRGSG